MRMQKMLILVPMSAMVLMSGCATILSGSHQKINITSNPPQKEVTIGYQTVMTPAIVEVERDDRDLIVKAKECNDQKVVSSKINPVFFVNILSGGVFGSTTDYGSGSMWEYEDNINLNCQ